LLAFAVEQDEVAEARAFGGPHEAVAQRLVLELVERLEDPVQVDPDVAALLREQLRLTARHAITDEVEAILLAALELDEQVAAGVARLARPVQVDADVAAARREVLVITARRARPDEVEAFLRAVLELDEQVAAGEPVDAREVEVVRALRRGDLGGAEVEPAH